MTPDWLKRKSFPRSLSPPSRRLSSHGSQRNISVLFLRQSDALAFQEAESLDQPRARLGRLDDLVDVAAPRGHVGVGEVLDVLRDLLRAQLRWSIWGELPPVEDVDSAFRPH